ncbi:unnamed protein product, partial [Rotaria magnacalcarata]
SQTGKIVPWDAQRVVPAMLFGRIVYKALDESTPSVEERHDQLQQLLLLIRIPREAMSCKASS